MLSENDALPPSPPGAQPFSMVGTTKVAHLPPSDQRLTNLRRLVNIPSHIGQLLVTHRTIPRLSWGQTRPENPS